VQSENAGMRLVDPPEPVDNAILRPVSAFMRATESGMYVTAPAMPVAEAAMRDAPYSDAP
jgi:hypothetical protein